MASRISIGRSLIVASLWPSCLFVYDETYVHNQTKGSDSNNKGTYMNDIQCNIYNLYIFAKAVLKCLLDFYYK